MEDWPCIGAHVVMSRGWMVTHAWWLRDGRNQSLGSLWKSTLSSPRYNTLLFSHLQCNAMTPLVAVRGRRVPVDSPAFASLQELTPSLEHQQCPWHENTPVLLLHSPGAEKLSWHELEAQSFPSSSVFQSSKSGVLRSSCYDDLSRSR